MTALSLDFSAYLDALCDRYQQWQTLYTLTDVEGKQKLQEKLENQPGQWDSPFDFGLMVQTPVKVTRKLNPETEREEKEKVERFPVLEGIRKYAKNHVLLVGRPGSGKSTALARLVLDEARQKQVIPVLVELRSWQGSVFGSSIVALIGNALGRHGLTLTEEQLESLWQDDRLLLLFDGLNELPSEAARSQLTAFRRDHPKIPMIFTTRDLSLGGDFGIEKRLEMQPLTELQMQEFVRSYIPDQAEQMLRQLKERLRELGQTPLLLWMLCDLFRTTGEIPENLGLVFRLFTQGYERNLKGDVPIESDREWWKPVLQQLAWVMMQGEQPTELRVMIGKAEAVRAIGQFLEGKVPYAEDFARKCLRDLQRHHLIQAGAGNEELEFRHQLIQEYYAAEALLERLPGLSDAVLQREYLNYLKWTEPVALMLALVESEGQALRVVRSGLEVDLRLGARLAGEVKLGFQEQAVKSIDCHDFPQWLKCRLLAETCSDEAIRQLGKILSNQDRFVRVSAIEALGRIGTDEAISFLLRGLEDRDEEVIYEAARWLRKLASVSLIPDLIEMLDRLDSYGREKAKSVVGILLDKIDSIEDLNLSRQTNPDTVDYVKKYLKLKLNVRIFSPHIQAEKKDPIAQIPCNPESFISIDIEKIRNLVKLIEDPGFQELLKADNFQDHDDAWLFLEEQAHKADLESAFESPNLKIRNQALQFSELLLYVMNQMTKDANALESRVPIEFITREVLSCIFRLKGSLGSKKMEQISAIATSILLNLLQDPDEHVIVEVVYALGIIGNQETIAILRTFLQDSRPYVRGSAAQVLGEIRDGHEQSIHLLQELLSTDEFQNVRESAAYALGEISQKISMVTFLPSFMNRIPQDSGKYVQRLVATIQSKCKYYNHGIYNKPVGSIDPKLIADKRSIESSPVINVKELTIVTDKPPIFNQQNATIGVNYASEGSKQEFTQNVAPVQNLAEAAAEIQQLLT